MNLSDRQTEILALIRRQGFMTVEALATRFAVTTQTIRRDVNALCDLDMLRRRHGRAEAIDPAINQPYDARRVTRLAAKRRIGRLVAARIPNYASVMIGIGTTPEQVAHALTGHEDLIVVTNNLNVAFALSANGSHQIIIPEGTVRLPDRDLLGAKVERLFQGFRADFGIFGVGGIDIDGTLLDFTAEEVAARRAIRENCRQAILVADVTKIDRPSPAQGGHLHDLDAVVFDAAPPPAILDLIADSRVEMILPEQVEA